MRLFILILLFTSCTKAQDFTGNYKSYSTSFSNETNPEQNFKEQAEFNLSITPNNIIIQDVKMPDKMLTYTITKPLEQLNELYVYNDCINEHLKSKTTSTLTFYRKDSKLNLMVSNEQYSQVFFDLKQQLIPNKNE